LIFSNGSYLFIHDTHITAPGYITDPIIVSHDSPNRIFLAELSNNLKLSCFLILLPYFCFSIHARRDESLGHQHLLFLVFRVHVGAIISQQQARVGAWSPWKPSDASIVSFKSILCPRVILCFLNNNNLSIGWASYEEKSIFPGGKGTWVHRGPSFKLVDTLPGVNSCFFPNFNGLIISACCDHIFVLGVGPRDLPDGSGVSTQRQ